VLQDAGGQNEDKAVAINASGESVGYSANGDDGIDAVLWSPTGAAKVLQDVPGGLGNDQAFAINASGQSIGYAQSANGSPEAVLWSPTGAATVLTGPDLAQAVVSAINNAGESVGYFAADNGSDAALWSPTGTVTNLNRILGSGWSDTEATGINNAGDIIGHGDYQDAQAAFLLMHVRGASSDDYRATFDGGSASTLAVHNLDLSHRS
jgi:probable HAF family extracellular repeat protein